MKRVGKQRARKYHVEEIILVKLFQSQKIDRDIDDGGGDFITLQ